MSDTDSADRRSETSCCDGPTFYFVNDAAMDSVREQFATADRMLKDVGLAGKQINHEIMLMFAELAARRRMPTELLDRLNTKAQALDEMATKEESHERARLRGKAAGVRLAITDIETDLRLTTPVQPVTSRE